MKKMKIIDLKNKHKGQSCLIIGNGPSAKGLINKKLEYDVVIGTNQAICDFNMNYWLLLESDAHNKKWITNAKNKMPFICNAKIAHKLPNKNKIPVWRTFSKKLNLSVPLKNKNGEEGLYIGPIISGLSVGTVMAQALHFACILGIKNVDIIGCEMYFAGGQEHYYGGDFYKKSVASGKRKDKLKIVKVGGETTTDHFVDSVPILKGLIGRMKKELNMEVNILCKSLISEIP